MNIKYLFTLLPTISILIIETIFSNSVLGLWTQGNDSILKFEKSVIAKDNKPQKPDKLPHEKPLHLQYRSCPDDLETLTKLLIRDLPAYANRISQSSRKLERTYDTYSYIIVAGNPDLQPLNFNSAEYTQKVSEDIKQLFITTLERYYTSIEAVELQQYHWLFLTKTTTGWDLSLLFSRIGTYPSGQPPSAPKESSNGVIGQGIRLWLRDCRAGSIHS